MKAKLHGMWIKRYDNTIHTEEDSKDKKKLPKREIFMCRTALPRDHRMFEKEVMYV